MTPRTYFIMLAGVFNALLIFRLIVSPIVETDSRPWYTTIVPGRTEHLDPTRRVLLPSFIEPRCVPTGFWGAAAVWRPTPEQIARLEEDLSWFLPQVDSLTASSGTPGRARLTSYHRQYFGLHVLGEPPVIYVNAFVTDDYGGPDRWRREIVCVEDGGDWYWHLEYDPAGRRIRRFGFNGTA